jgi:hypothetical protein
VDPVSSWQIPPRERTHTTSTSHAGALGDRARRVGKVANAKCAHHSVERAVVEGHRINTCFAKRAAGIQPGGELKHTRREVHAGDEGAAQRCVLRDHTGSAGHVEHAHARANHGLC